jgi:hypothetical protein
VGDPAGEKRPVEGSALDKKIDNFLPNRLVSGIVFQKLAQLDCVSHGRPTETLAVVDRK